MVKVEDFPPIIRNYIMLLNPMTHREDSMTTRTRQLRVRMESSNDGMFRYTWQWTVPYPKYLWTSKEFASQADAEKAMREFIAKQTRGAGHVVLE
jgi:hypothetical protein